MPGGGVISRCFQAAGVATRLIFGMINSVVEWYRPDGPVDPELLAEQILAVALGGFQARR